MFLTKKQNPIRDGKIVWEVVWETCYISALFYTYESQIKFPVPQWGLEGWKYKFECY